MDVSVIIPTFNRLWSLPRAIQSCKGTNCKTEIIVVDDGSTDGTWEWLQTQNNINIIQQSNWGKCWAVNKGFDLCKGKYVKFLDSDDSLVAGAIDEQFIIAEANSCDIVVSGYQLVTEQNELLKLQAWIECDDFIAQQLGECDSSHYSAYLFRKSFIADIPHRPDYAYRDDRLFVIETALKLPKISIHSGFSLCHTSHTRSKLQTTNGTQKIIQNYQHLSIYKKAIEQLHINGNLTTRRIKASINVLWPLCQWIAKYNISEAFKVVQWIYLLDPNFTIPQGGILGFLYRKLGFKATERLLRIRRFIKYWK